MTVLHGATRALATLVLAATVVLTLVPGAGAQSARASEAAALLHDLGFTLQNTLPDKNSISFTSRGLLVPTPWGDFEATIVSTPVDRMVRVPLSPNSDPGQPRLQPYVTAGSRKNVDGDSVLEQSRPTSFGDTGRTNLKAGAGVVLKLDDKVEIFGEYQFMQLYRDAQNRGALGPLGTTLDTSGFSLGLSVRY